MRYRLACLAVLLACIFVVSACDNPFPIVVEHIGSSPPTPKITTILSGTSWVLVELRSNGKSQVLIPTAPITLEFQRDGDSYIGSSGCNYYNGVYAVSGIQLHLQFKEVTQRACVGPIMSQEVTYLKALQQITRYQRDGQMLTLIESLNYSVLVFKAG